jgi:hypothetical protein
VPGDAPADRSADHRLANAIPGPFSRIVLGLGARPSPSALAMAADLAQAMRLQLLGLFIEDDDLLHMAGLPFAREIAYPSARSRPIDPAAMERALQASAHAARQALQHRLAGLPVNWAFEVVRGPVVTRLLASVVQTDLIVLAAPAGTATGAMPGSGAIVMSLRAARAALMLVREDRPRGQPVAVLASPDASAPAVAATVVALAQPGGGPVTCLLASPGDGAPGRWEAQLARLLAARGITVEVHRVTGDGEEVRRWLALARPGMLVVAGAQALDETLLPDVAAIGCSLLLLPAGAVGVEPAEAARSGP